MRVSLKSIGNYARTGAFIARSRRQYSQAPSDEVVVRPLEGADKGITVLGLNRPQRKNAFSSNLVSQIYGALDRISFESETRVLVVRSLAPGIFCAGADLRERASMTEQQVSAYAKNLRGLMDRIHDLRLPVIAALDGAALGGGLELALACDIRVAASDAPMGLVEGKWAIIPGAGGTQRLPRLINPAVAKELIFTARVIDGAEAKDLGLVNHVVVQNSSNDAAYSKAVEIAQEILPNGPIAARMAKTAINKGLQVDLSTGMTIEEGCYAQLLPTKDRIEGLRAFKEKRKPVYVGQ